MQLQTAPTSCPDPVRSPQLPPPSAETTAAADTSPTVHYSSISAGSGGRFSHHAAIFAENVTQFASHDRPERRSHIHVLCAPASAARSTHAEAKQDDAKPLLPDV